MLSTNDHQLKTTCGVGVWGDIILKRSILGRKRKKQFRKMKQNYKEVYSIHPIYYESRSEIYFLRF